MQCHGFVEYLAQMHNCTIEQCYNRLKPLFAKATFAEQCLVTGLVAQVRPLAQSDRSFQISYMKYRLYRLDYKVLCAG